MARPSAVTSIFFADEERENQDARYVSLMSVVHPYKEDLLALRILIFCFEACFTRMMSILRQ